LVLSDPPMFLNDSKSRHWISVGSTCCALQLLGLGQDMDGDYMEDESPQAPRCGSRSSFGGPSMTEILSHVQHKKMLASSS
jgi:hypothetical protein